MLELKPVMMAESSPRCVSGAERSAGLDDCRELGGAMTKGGRISLEEENRVGDVQDRGTTFDAAINLTSIRTWSQNPYPCQLGRS
jgi:hypothetical protein